MFAISGSDGDDFTHRLVDADLLGGNVTIRETNSPGGIRIASGGTFSSPNKLTIKSDNGGIVFDAIVANTGIGGTFVLDAQDGVSQSAGNTIVVENLVLKGTGDFTLPLNNDVS